MDNPVHIEIVQKRESSNSKNHIKRLVHNYLMNFTSLTPGETIEDVQFDSDAEIKQHVRSIHICEEDHDSEVSMADVNPIYHTYRLHALGAEAELTTETAPGSGEEVPAALVRPLPALELHGLWESLHYEDRTKVDTLRFVETAFELAERGVDPNLVGCNRVVLLHGPPGTGKTSLCRALAQKLAVRLSERFPRAALVEVNAHSLFSKWFSESGKLVSAMFARVRELLEDRRLLVVVLVDEVESLTHARAACSGVEPSDALRVVNAVLTQLDALRRFDNALVLATSNVTGAIDAAFLDRADVRRYVGPPGERATYRVLRAGVAELMRTGVLEREQVFPLRLLDACGMAASVATRPSLELLATARAAAAAGLSGRALRRLPLLALVQLPSRRRASLTTFVDALLCAVRDYQADSDRLGPRNEAQS